jgi:hypothetical protein
MAETKTIKINVDTKGAVSAMDNLSKATHDVSQSFEEVYGDLQPLTTRMGEAEDRLYELANAGKTTTKEYKDLLASVGNYRKVQIQTDLAVDSAASTMGQKLGGALSGVTSGFSVATGLMGTFGSDSEELEKLLLRVNAAMAMAQGIQGIKEAIPMFTALGTSIGKIPVVQKLVTAGQYLWNLAVSLNPIGLLVTVIIGLIAVGTALVSWFNSSSEATAKNTKAVESNEKALKKQSNTLKNKSTEAERAANQELAMAKASGMSAKAIRQLELKLIDEKIARERSTKATLLDTYETNKNSLAKLRAAGADEELIKKQAELTAEAGKNILTQNDNIKNALSQKKDIINAHLVEIKTAEVQSDNESKTRASEREKERLELIAEAKKIELEKQKEFLKQIDELKEKNIQSGLTDTENELRKINAKYKALEDAAIGNAEQLKIIAEAKGNEIAIVNKKYLDKELADLIAKEDAQFKLSQELNETKQEQEITNLVQSYEAKFAIAGENDELEKQLIEQQKIEIDAINKKYNDKEISDAKAVNDAKIEIQKRGLDIATQGISLISSVFQKSKGVQKAALIAESGIGIAKMIISNNAANIAALATPQAIASSGIAAIPVIAANNISTGLGIAANIAATAKALKSLGGGSPPSPSNTSGNTAAAGVGGGQPQAPSFNIVGNSNVNQLSQLQNQPMKAYVVSGDVSSAQSLDRNRIENATL